MRQFLRFFRPRSWKSLSVWLGLFAVGLISCLGLSLAMGFRSGTLSQFETVSLRDGGGGFSPRTREPGEPPLRFKSPVATGYGAMTVTVYWGEEGQRLDVPGIPRVGASGSALASPALLVQAKDDWTGEIAGWLGDRPVGRLQREALAHPRELAIVEFTDSVPPEIASKSSFQPIRRGGGWAPDTGFVVVGLLILVLPTIALARGGARAHLNARSARYSLLRLLGATPRQLSAIIAADMGAPILPGALLGSAAYAAVMSSMDSFTIAGNSYWASDLRLPLSMALALPAVVALVAMASAARMVVRAGRDPLGTLRRERKPPSYLAYLAAGGVLVAPAAVYAAAEADFTLSPWLITAGMLLMVVGLGGLSRIAVAVSGKLLLSRTRAQVAGSRMSRSGAEALLGVSATSIAVLLIVFAVYANFDKRPAPLGDFDVLADLPNLSESAPIVRAMERVEGVSRVVAMGRLPVQIDGRETSAYTMTCDDARGSVQFDAPCAVGRVYLGPALARGLSADAVTLQGHDYPGIPGGSQDNPDIAGSYPVGGQVIMPWSSSEADEAALIVDEFPSPEHTLLLVTTDGEPGSLRRVLEGLRSRPEESYATTRAALTSGATEDALVLFPYLFVMATAAAGIASVALLFAVLLLLRQRQAEFRMLRSLGATRTLFAVDLALLFALPMLLAFALAVASGLALAAAYNASFGVPPPQLNPQAGPILGFVLAIGLSATVFVSVRAARIPALVSDPDAAAG